MTLKAIGNVLFDRQWVGKAVHRNEGDPVLTSSPEIDRSFWEIVTQISMLNFKLFPLIPLLKNYYYFVNAGQLHLERNYFKLF